MRHSRSIHGSASEIINVNIHPNTPYYLNNKFIRFQKKLNILNQAYKEVYNEYNENVSDIFDINEEDIKIIKIINQLVKPFNELEDLLDHVNPKTKAFVLTSSFDQSIQSTNPVASMNEMIELVRAINGIKKIADYRSMVDKTTSNPVSDIKEKIKNSILFKRQNN